MLFKENIFFFRKSLVLWFWKLLQRSRILVSTAEFSGLVNVLLIKSCSEFFIWNRFSYFELVYNLILGNTVDSWFCHQFCLLMRDVHYSGVYYYQSTLYLAIKFFHVKGAKIITYRHTLRGNKAIVTVTLFCNSCIKISLETKCRINRTW